MYLCDIINEVYTFDACLSSRFPAFHRFLILYKTAWIGMGMFRLDSVGYDREIEK